MPSAKPIVLPLMVPRYMDMNDASAAQWYMHCCELFLLPLYGTQVYEQQSDKGGSVSRL